MFQPIKGGNVGQINCASSTKTWTAIGTNNGVMIYENKGRRLSLNQCMGLPAGFTSQRRPQKKNDPCKRRDEFEIRSCISFEGLTQVLLAAEPRPEPVPLKAQIESIKFDQNIQSLLYAGTADGRVLVLQVSSAALAPDEESLCLRALHAWQLLTLEAVQVRTGEKGRVMCTVLHDISVLQDAGQEGVPVEVSAINGYFIAAASSKTVISVCPSTHSLTPCDVPCHSFPCF